MALAVAAITSGHWQRGSGLVPDRAYSTHNLYRRRVPQTSAPATSPMLDAPHASVGFDLSRHDHEKLRLEKNAADKALEDLKARVEDLQGKMRTLEEELERLAHSEKALDDQLRSEKIKHEQELSEIRRQADPERRENEKVLASARQDGANETVRVYEVKMKKLMAGHKKRLEHHEKQLAHQEKHGQAIVELRQELQNQTEQCQSLKQRLYAADAKNLLLQQQLAGRKEREASDRKEYRLYREIYNHLEHPLHLLTRQLGRLRICMEHEASMWRSDLNQFLESKTLWAFHQQVKNTKLKKSIAGFLESRRDEAQEAAVALKELRTRSSQEEDTWSHESHLSRQLTEHHHMVLKSAYETVTFAHTLQMQPFSAKKENTERRLLELRERLQESSSQSELEELGKTCRELEDEVSFWKAILNILNIKRRVDAYETLLHDSTVEKVAWLRSLEVKEQVMRSNEQYVALGHSGPAGSTRSGKVALFRDSRENRTQAMRQLAAYEELVMRRCIFEEQIGKLSQEDRDDADKEINRLLAERKEILERNLARLGPVVKGNLKASSPARRRALRSVPAVTRPSARASTIDPVLVGKSFKKMRQSGRSIAQSLEVLKLELAMKQRTREKTLDSQLTAEAKESKLGELDIHISGLEGKIRKLSHAANIEEPDPTPEAASSGTSARDAQSEKHDSSPRLLELARSRSRNRRRARRRSKRKASVEAQPVAAGESSRAMGTAFKPTSPLQAHCTSFYLDFEAAHVSSTSTAKTASCGNQGRQSKNSSSSNSGNRYPASAVTSQDTGDLNSTPTSCHGTAFGNTGSSSDSESSFSDVASSTASQASDEQHTEEIMDESDDSHIELSYQIRAEDYRAAITTSPTSEAAFWSYRLYKNAEGKHPSVHYCTTLEQCETQAKLFLDEPVLGFDLEWEPSEKGDNIKRRVSLIQIAAEDKIGLFHVACFNGDRIDQLLAPSLRTILESPKIIKCGVNIVGDSNRMQTWLGVDMHGVFELSHLYRVVKFSEHQPRDVNFKLVRLAVQVHNVLLLPLKKDSVRMSAWSRPLNMQQTDYAASDAYAGFRVYHKLNSERQAMEPKPPRPAFLEADAPLILGNGQKVFKSTQRRLGVTDSASKTAVDTGDDEEGEDEFFDTVEEHEIPEAVLAELPPDSLALEDEAQAKVAYPSLPNANDEPSLGVTQQQVTSPNTSSFELPHRPKVTRPDPPEVQAADTWADRWRSSLPREYNLAARPRELRAYHLWHEQSLSLQQVAALSRDPPLAATTVASYIMQAVKEENLPYDARRVRDVLDCLPKSVWRRYQRIVDQAGMQQ